MEAGITDEQLDAVAAAIEAEDYESAMLDLKRVLDKTPGDAMALYLLSTVHAATGMHERAAEELWAVLESEPEFHVARFQLGLIYLAHGQGAEVLEAWEHYRTLPEDDCFFLFRRGIEHFLADRLQESVRDLEASIANNDHYLSVVEDMQGILEEISGLEATLAG